MNAMAPSAAVELSEAEFAALTAIAAREAGLEIPSAKKSLVQSRVSRRWRHLKISNCKEYLAILDERPEEVRELISVLTTNVSSFYREAHHFEFLRQKVFPVVRDKLARGGRVRFWSAGCSSGQEPYSIAIECLKGLPGCAAQDLLILASDIDPKILARAEAGIYTASDLAALEAEDRRSYFTAVPGSEDSFQANDTLRKLVRFRELNLHAPWPMKQTFDVIFCRNVVIYFDDAHQAALWPRFRDQLEPDGCLILGHSERIQDIDNSGFRSAGVTIYQRS